MRQSSILNTIISSQFCIVNNDIAQFKFIKMTQFKVPQKEDVSPNNQAIFDKLKSALGMVPNLYATMAYSDTGLENYLGLQNGKTSLNKKEKEAINLVVSQVNNCR